MATTSMDGVSVIREMIERAHPDQLRGLLETRRRAVADRLPGEAVRTEGAQVGGLLVQVAHAEVEVHSVLDRLQLRDTLEWELDSIPVFRKEP